MFSKNVPFEFVLDCLCPVEVRIRPMFGMYAVYNGDKILLMLRKQQRKKELNGIWVATEKKFSGALLQEFTNLQPIKEFTNDKINSEWLLLAENTENFETNAISICKCIINGDQRIGRTSFTL